MKAHDNAHKLVQWMREHQSATVAQIAANGVMNSRDASDTVQYCVRHGVLERVQRSSAGADARVQYHLTGKALPIVKTAAAPCFDGLLQAWGIARTPPRLDLLTARKIELMG